VVVDREGIIEQYPMDLKQAMKVCNALRNSPEEEVVVVVHLLRERERLAEMQWVQLDSGPVSLLSAKMCSLEVVGGWVGLGLVATVEGLLFLATYPRSKSHRRRQTMEAYPPPQ
jgi:hypothetical protein